MCTYVSTSVPKKEVFLHQPFPHTRALEFCMYILYVYMKKYVCVYIYL